VRVGTFGLSAPAAGTRTLRIAVGKGQDGARTINITVRLLADSVTKHTWTYNGVAAIGSESTKVETITASITDYSSIAVEVEGNTTGGGSPSTAAVSWLEIELPDAAGTTDGEVSEPASVRVALRGEVSEPGSLRAALRGEVSEPGSVRVALPGQVSSAASTYLSVRSRVAVAASLWLALAGQVSSAASMLVEVGGDGQVTAAASMRVAVQQIFETSLTAVGDPGVDTGHWVKYRVGKDAAGGETIKLGVGLYQGATEIWSVTETLGATQLKHGIVEVPSGQIAAITNHADLRLRALALHVADGAARQARVYWWKVEIPPGGALLGEVSEPASVLVSLPGEVSESASLRVALPGEVSEPASVLVAGRSEVSAVASTLLSVRSQTTEPASVWVGLRGETSEPASVLISGNGEVASVASMLVEVSGASEVSKPASVRVAQRSEISSPASTTIALRGQAQSVASVRVAQAGQAQAPASVYIAVPSAVTRAASVRVALPGATSVAASALIGFAGQVSSAASVLVSVRVLDIIEPTWVDLEPSATTVVLSPSATTVVLTDSSTAATLSTDGQTRATVAASSTTAEILGMDETFTIKQGDTIPPLLATLYDETGTALDLTGGSVRFHMRQEGRSTPKVDAAAVIVDAPNGIVRYDWDSGGADTDVASDDWQGEFEVTTQGGDIVTCPNDDYIPIIIKPQLA
jgi:hypothetical protein